MIESRGHQIRWFSTRVRQLPSSRLLLLGKTFLLLLSARIALAVLPIRYIFDWKSRPVVPATNYSSAQLRTTVELVAWSVECIANRSPFKFVCFPQCLAAVALLRSVGVESRLHYGVARVENRLVTHTWLEAGGEVLVGRVAADGFSTLKVY